ncbi:MAG: TRAP transporter permease [Candidatus Accumulibacter sp.]|jgi:TRAP transporter 4TM/12TM fusion protein|nr:TRAP transporter permease [Accumulibacter sp.]
MSEKPTNTPANQNGAEAGSATPKNPETRINLNELAQAREGVLTEEQLKIIEEVDKESKVRNLDSPILSRVLYLACIAVALYHFITSFVGTPVVLEHRSLHVGMMLVLGFILYPFKGKSSFKKVAWYDWIFVALSIVVPLYVWIDYLGVIERAGMPNTSDLVIATMLVVLVLEATRRMTGWPLVLISLVFIAYGLFGRDMPGIFGHRGYTWLQLSNHFFANTEGIYGTSVNVAASYIFLFILFGTVMSKSGMGSFFNDLAMALAGSAKGGPAKVAVISSAMLGSINGSAVANTVTAGAFTIPLMKKVGYSKDFAGAVEACASVGGQALPPVMGAAAFIMAEMLGVSYSVIIVHAAIPALLYYLGVLIQVHLRAGKEGLVGLPRDQLPKVMAVLKDKGHLLIPIILLLYLLLLSGYTVIFSAVITIVATIVIAGLKKNTRMSFKDVCDAFAEGAKQTVSVAMACACVGIVIGVTSKTGFGLTMANAIVSMGHQNLLFTLFFSMVTCMILGMGVPSIPAYIITATIAAPALAKLGIPAMAAHLFAFYYAMFANLTPPVALAAFAAAGISGGDPMKTGFMSVKLAIAGFIVPFMFVYSPSLMLIDTTWLEGIHVVITACIGVFLIGVAAEGYLFTKVNVILRLIALGCAFALIDPGWQTDIMGLAGLVLVVGLQHFLAQKERKAAVS